jgi:hypothetical protein
MNATGGKMTSCMIAVGSYLSGDESWFSQLSTSTYDLKNGPAAIKEPTSVQPELAAQIAPLPCYIPGGFYEKSLLDHCENQVLLNLHTTCLVRKVKGEPVRALLLELILCGNGAVLSDRALAIIGLLAKQHNFHIIVDEIMTGGRIASSEQSKMLHLLSKPKEFQEVVAYVTFGKWLDNGVVVVKNSLKSELMPVLDTYRGVPTHHNLGTTVSNWETVAATDLQVFRDRRSKVLKTLKLRDDEAWGEGLLIFGPVERNDSKPALQSRFLPTLDDTKIDTFTRHRNKEWTRKKINNVVVHGVMKWVHHGSTQSGDHGMHSLLLGFLKERRLPNFFNKNNIVDAFGQGQSERMVSNLLGAAVKKEILCTKQVGSKRVRSWALTTHSLPPF